MGADLCGYVLVGPKKLKASAKAVRLCEKVAAKLTAAAEAANEKKTEIALGDFWNEFSHYPDELLEMLRLLPPHQLIDDFVRFWNRDDIPRDSMAKSYKDRRIVVAGERTWGDGPAEGSAWYLCQVASLCGLFEVFGIE